jgi:hypothetical protein
VKPQLIEEHGGDPDLLGQRPGVFKQLLAQQREDGLFEREDEGGGFGGREALFRHGPGDIF